jgi:hypothetical protein
MDEKDHDGEQDDSPNPPFVIGKPDNEHPDARRARLYQHHKRNGTLGVFYEMYPRDGVTAEDIQREPRVFGRGRGGGRGR